MQANSGKPAGAKGKWLVIVLLAAAVILAVIGMRFTKHRPDGPTRLPTSVGD